MEFKAILEVELKNHRDAPSSKRVAWVRAKRKTKALRKKLAEVHSELPCRFSQLENYRIKIELSNVHFLQEHLEAGVERLESFAASTTQQLVRLSDVEETQSEILLATQQTQADMKVVSQALQHTHPRSSRYGELLHQGSVSSTSLASGGPTHK